MSTCPFMSKGNKMDEISPCIISCALRVKDTCAFSVLAQKALHDAKREANLDAKNNAAKATDSSSNT